MKAVVTIKLSYNPKHDPQNKKTDWCPANPKICCTDATGAHHSFVVEGYCMKEISEAVKKMYRHITRIEFFDDCDIVQV